MHVMPEGSDADAAVYTDTDSYIWEYEHYNNAQMSNETGARI
jgi:hypothetical protein